jgi:anti-sigma28 factor (negative regulator of flagellin synthesis)
MLVETGNTERSDSMCHHDLVRMPCCECSTGNWNESNNALTLFKPILEGKAIKANKAAPEIHDEVDLSDTAKALAGHQAGSDYENEQYLKVGRLKSLVSSGNYHMDPSMVETIAERIANMLV